MISFRIAAAGSRRAGRAADGGRDADIVAARQFVERSALRAASGGLLLHQGVAHLFSLALGAAPAFGSAGAD